MEKKKKVQGKLFLYSCFKSYSQINLNLVQNKSVHHPHLSSLIILNAQQISKYFCLTFYFSNQGSMNGIIFL